MLITIERGEIPAQSFDDYPLRAQRITAGRLDLNDLSPHVCQEQRAEGAGENARQINHAYALQMHRSHISCRCALPAKLTVTPGPCGGTVAKCQAVYNSRGRQHVWITG